MLLSTTISPDGGLPASLDWGGASVIARPQRVLVVLELPTTTSIRARLPTTGGYLHRHAEDFGLVPTTKRGGAPAHPTEWEVWITSGGLVVRGANRSRGTLARIPAEQVQLRATTDVGELVDLVIAPQSPRNFRTASEFLRAAGPHSVAGQATIGAVPYHASKPRYIFLNSRGEDRRSPPANASVFIDQNVLADLKAALEPDTRRRFQLPELRDQMAWVAQLDGIPGFAIGECRAAMDRSAADALRAAWDAWAEGRPGRDTIPQLRGRYVANIESADAADQQQRAGMPAGRGLCALNYLALLEAIEPYRRLRDRRFNATEHIDAFEEWVDRMNQPQIGMPGHMGHAVRRILLGKVGTKDASESAKLLKLSKDGPPTVEDLRGAAYDMIYPTLCDMATAGALPGEFGSEVFVMTADKPMAKARLEAVLAPVVIDSPAGMSGYLMSKAPYLDEYSPRQVRRIFDIEERLALGAHVRSHSEPIADWTVLNNLVDHVETDLIARKLIRPR